MRLQVAASDFTLPSVPVIRAGMFAPNILRDLPPLARRAFPRPGPTEREKFLRSRQVPPPIVRNVQDIRAPTVKVPCVCVHMHILPRALLQPPETYKSILSTNKLRICFRECAQIWGGANICDMGCV